MNNTHENCKLVVFSNKAWNAIVCETMRKDPVETGGILLGHILSNGYWIVMEVVPPGLKSIHQRAYFEYDTDYVNYAAYSLSKQYKMELSVLGLWHRHPGSMDVFSGTDDGTNATFAQMNPYGAISGLVNIDPKLRFTLRHVAYPLHYQIVDAEVGDDLIPSQYFELKYSFGDELIPLVPTGNGESPKTRIAEPEKRGGSSLPVPTNHRENDTNNLKDFNWDVTLKNKKMYLLFIIPLIVFFVGMGIGHACGKKKATTKQPDTEQIIKEKDNNISDLQGKIEKQTRTIVELQDSISILSKRIPRQNTTTKTNPAKPSREEVKNSNGTN